MDIDELMSLLWEMEDFVSDVSAVTGKHLEKLPKKGGDLAFE